MAALALDVVGGGAALAQTSAAPALEELVVTAQRREENQQSVPIVINAVTAEMAKDRGIEDATDLAILSPGLVFNQSTNSGLVFLRGVGAGSGAAGLEGSVALYLDDVYIYSLYGNRFGLNNIERIEVANGPQGTLFGRNAVAGVVQVITKQPKHETSGEATLGYGNYSTVRGTFYGTTGLTDSVAVDLALLYEDQNKGYGRNLVTGQPVFLSSEKSGRVKLFWTPRSDTEVTLSVLYDELDGNAGYAARLLPGSVGRDGSVAPASFYDTNQNLTGFFRNKSWVNSLIAKHDFGPVSLKSITSYQTDHVVGAQDSDFTPTFFASQDPIDQFTHTWTQEIQLVSGPESKLEWIVGAFYLNNRSGYNVVHLNTNPPSATLGRYTAILSSLNTLSYAAFAQASYPLTDSTKLTAGIRYTYDKKHVYGVLVGETGVISSQADSRQSWGSTTYHAALNHEFADGILGYVSFSRGFKAGSLNATAPTAPAVNPEILDDYEVGLKTTLFERRLRWNTAAFYYDYKDVQLRQVVPAGSLLLNAAHERIYGVDMSFDAAVTNRLNLQAAFEWLHTEYLSFPGAPATRRAARGNTTVPTDFAGRRVLLAPKFTATVGAQYTVPLASGELQLAANYSYNSGFSWTPEVDDRAHERAYALVNGSLTWTPADGPWSVRAWGKNITGVKYNAFVNTNANGDYGSAAPPATYGVELAVRF